MNAPAVTATVRFEGLVRAEIADELDLEHGDVVLTDGRVAFDGLGILLSDADDEGADLYAVASTPDASEIVVRAPGASELAELERRLTRAFGLDEWEIGCRDCGRSLDSNDLRSTDPTRCDSCETQARHDAL